MLVQTSIRLVVAALSFSLIGCKPPITATDAAAIGRKACAATEKKLSDYYGTNLRTRPNDWKAFDDGVSWVATANVGLYNYQVVITRAGSPVGCKARHIDA